MPETAKTVMLLASDPALRAELLATLGDWGYGVVAVGQADEALAAFVHRDPVIDLVLVAAGEAFATLDGLDIPVIHCTRGSAPEALKLTLRSALILQTKHRALARPTDIFARVFELSPDAITLSRASDGLIITANPAFCRIVGYSLEEVVGRAPGSAEFPLWNSLADRDRVVSQLARDGEIVNVSADFRAKNGEVVRGLISGRLIEYEGATCILGISRDVTEYLRTQDQNDHLMRNADRLESIGVLAGGIAHDFNNLLSGMSGHLELARMLLENQRPDDAIVRLDKAAQVFQRAKALTRQLLTFSKGGSPLRQPHQLGPLLKEWADFALSGSSVSLVLDLAADLWLCECDEMQIGQAIDNLLINARQVTPSGGKIHVIAENLPGEPPRVAVHVQDEGPGVPAELQARIFDPFFTTKTTGSGLGLASAQSIVRSHGGSLSLDSPPGRGARFTLTLPALASRGTQGAQAGRGHFVGGGWALVLDDEETLRDTVGEMVASLGFQVLRAANGEEALREYQAAVERGADIRLAVLDLTVEGGLAGAETAAKLRALGSEAVIVAMTGFAEENVTAKFGPEGFNGALGKPFSRLELGRALERWFAGAS